MNSAEEFPRAAESSKDSSGDSKPPLIIRAADRLQGRREVWIKAGREMYRLRVIAGGKLYLSILWATA